MPSPQVRRQEQEILDTISSMFNGRVHLDVTRWYSRNPDNLTWEPDRFLGRRFEVLVELGDQLADDPEYRATRWPNWLHTRADQYRILQQVSSRMRALPVPPGFSA